MPYEEEAKLIVPGITDNPIASSESKAIRTILTKKESHQKTPQKKATYQEGTQNNPI